MLTLPGYSAARTLMVAQACRDAIDRDHHFVSLHTPASDPMHELLVTAGGSWICDGTTAGQWMLKLLSPDRWTERLYPLLHERAREAGISRPVEIDFLMGEARRRLVLTRRSARLENATQPSPLQVSCDSGAFQELLTGNLMVADAFASERLRGNDHAIPTILSALFPATLFWRSPFSLLRLSG